MSEDLERPDSRAGQLIALATLLVVTGITLPGWLPEVVVEERARRISSFEGAGESLDRDFARFLELVRRHTDPEKSLLLVVPPGLGGPQHAWYSYRTEWVLAGRDVKPYFDPLTGRPLPRRIDDADLLLFWRAEPNYENLEVVMEWRDGRILRKR
ncbi:MAG: hypothetical protein R3338_06515 [Thermoanaerobaculia bacterium]|nr:hypothetical protein [Thermoanaerobaculia bacterium]